MPLIVAFDPSKATGWALWDTTRHHSSMRCGVFEMPAKADPYYTGDQIGLKVTGLLRDAKKEFGRMPDWAVLEEQSLAQIGRTSALAQIYPWGCSLAIVATLSNFGIPYGTLPPGTWRKAFFGSGFKPAIDKNGKKDWKAAAVEQCERLGIELPPKKTTSHNAAEACALAVCWGVKDMNLHAGRYHAPRMDLLMKRHERAEVA